MSARGTFIPVLHGHLPYLSHADHHLHEFTSNTLIPLLQALYRLQDENVPYALTISLSPLLIEQLNDLSASVAFNSFLDEQISISRQDYEFFQHNRLAIRDQEHEVNDHHLAYLAERHAARFESIKTDFNERFNRDIVGAFRQLQEANLIEMIASPISHAYLPLLKHDSSIARQVRMAVSHYQRIFDRRPTGMWLPELGYRPGLETLLADEGIKVFPCESHLLTGGPPVGMAAGEDRGPNSAVKRRFALAQRQIAPVRNTTTMQPYWADKNKCIATIARDNRSTMQVWGEAMGYPGDVDYREAQRRSGSSGLPYWRITGHDIGPDDKDDYHPEWGRYKVEQHAEHFAHLIGDMIRGYYAEAGQPGLIAPMFDMQLFGHWWFEGVDWLEQTCRHLANTPQIELNTMSQFVTAHPPTDSVELLEGSWGHGGNHFLVDNPETHWLWQRVQGAEDRIQQIFTKTLSENQLNIFNQAVRQLLLLQSSNWATMIASGQTDTYMIQQFNVHYERFVQLINTLDAGSTIEEPVKSHPEAMNRFSIFPEIDIS